MSVELMEAIVLLLLSQTSSIADANALVGKMLNKTPKLQTTIASLISKKISFSTQKTAAANAESIANIAPLLLSQTFSIADANAIVGKVLDKTPKLQTTIASLISKKTSFSTQKTAAANAESIANIALLLLYQTS